MSGLVSQRSGMDPLLPSEVPMVASRRQHCGSEPVGSRWLHVHHPPQAEAGVGSGGPRPPRRPQRVEGAPLPGGWRPALSVAGIPPWRGLGLVRSSRTLPTWTVTKPASSAPSRQTDPTSRMAKRTRIGKAAGTSPAATVRTNPARTRTSSTPTAPGPAAVLTGRTRSSGASCFGRHLELVDLHTQLGRGYIRSEITVWRTR